MVERRGRDRRSVPVSEKLQEQLRKEGSLGVLNCPNIVSLGFIERDRDREILGLLYAFPSLFFQGFVLNFTEVLERNSKKDLPKGFHIIILCFYVCV